MALGLRTTEVEVPAGSFSSYKAVLPHANTAPTQQTPQADGESTQSSPRENEVMGTVIPQSCTPLFLHLFSLSSLLQAMSCTRDTTDSLMLHYPYTSLSLSALLKAMFPDVASKLGHEHGTRRQGKERDGIKWCNIFYALFVIVL